MANGSEPTKHGCHMCLGALAEIEDLTECALYTVHLFCDVKHNFNLPSASPGLYMHICT